MRAPDTDDLDTGRIMSVRDMGLSVLMNCEDVALARLLGREMESALESGS